MDWCRCVESGKLIACKCDLSTLQRNENHLRMSENHLFTGNNSHNKTFVFLWDAANLLTQSNFWTMCSFAYCRNCHSPFNTFSERRTRNAHIEKIRQFESEVKFNFNVETNWVPTLRARVCTLFSAGDSASIFPRVESELEICTHAVRRWNFAQFVSWSLLSATQHFFISCVPVYHYSYRTMRTYTEPNEYFAPCLSLYNFFFVFVFFCFSFLFFVFVLRMCMQTV